MERFSKVFPSCSRLSTYLPHQVDEKQSRAQWDGQKQQLKITMRRVDTET